MFDDWIYGIAANDSVIAVSSRHKVFMFEMGSGRRVRSFGDRGIAQGQLFGGMGLRLTPDGTHILVAEAETNRLSLFTLTGDFVRCMGVGSLSRPDDLEFASNGDILVAEEEEHRICVLSADGSRLLRTFGSEGTYHGQFKSPSALAMHGNQLYVLDWGSARVQVLS